MLDLMSALGIFFNANRLLVFLCLTRLTHPNLPSPSFLSMAKSSMRLGLGVMTAESLRLMPEIELRVLPVVSWCSFSLDLVRSMSGEELKRASQLPLSTLGVRQQLFSSFAGFLNPRSSSFYFLWSSCRKVGDLYWFTFRSRSFSLPSRSLPSLPSLPSFLVVFLSSSIICLLRLIWSLSRSYSLRLLDSAMRSMPLRGGCPRQVSQYLLFLRSGSRSKSSPEYAQSGMRVSLQALAGLQVMVCLRKSLSLLALSSGAGSRRWLRVSLPRYLEFMVTRREAVSSGTFLRCSNSGKFETQGACSRAGSSCGCSGESYYTNLKGDFLKFISPRSPTRNSFGEYANLSFMKTQNNILKQTGQRAKLPIIIAYRNTRIFTQVPHNNAPRRPQFDCFEHPRIQPSLRFTPTHFPFSSPEPCSRQPNQHPPPIKHARCVAAQ